MPLGTIENIDIKGIACVVPDNLVLSEAFYDNFEKDSVDKFVSMTGVKSRFIANKNQTASDLCYLSAKKLMDSLSWTQESVDAILFVSQTPDYRLPATACVLHNRLGLNDNCLAFDINLGCSGYVYGLQVIGALMQTGNIKRVLLLCGDTPSKIISPMDKSTSMLFGDCGSATAIERVSEKQSSEIKYILKTKGNGYKAIIVPSGCYRNMDGSNIRTEMEEGVIRSDYELYMNGMDVFNFTISDVPKTINEFIQHFSIPLDSIDALVLHQANLFMLKHIAKKLKFPFEKVPVTIDKYGNTSVASIPLTMADSLNEKLKNNGKGLNLLLSGFGVGLSWGVINIKLEPEVFLSVERSNECYNDGGL
ncbi:MAG: ketoacyl-ACP synthase III [Tissierellia bacterium]|nr:ketoacyl-ACP synthase III [Tissierellia bacterium]